MSQEASHFPLCSLDSKEGMLAFSLWIEERPHGAGCVEMRARGEEGFGRMVVGGRTPEAEEATGAKLQAYLSNGTAGSRAEHIFRATVGDVLWNRAPQPFSPSWHAQKAVICLGLLG